MSKIPEAPSEPTENETLKHLSGYFPSTTWLPLPIRILGGLAGLLRHLLAEVRRVDEETPEVLERQLLCLPQRGEAEQLLRKLERVRTDVIHAFNTLEGLPKRREPFGVRLKRMNKEGLLPDIVYSQILKSSKYRNQAVYDGYRLSPKERTDAEQAMDAASKWAERVGFVY